MTLYCDRVREKAYLGNKMGFKASGMSETSAVGQSAVSQQDHDRSSSISVSCRWYTYNAAPPRRATPKICISYRGFLPKSRSYNPLPLNPFMRPFCTNPTLTPSSPVIQPGIFSPSSTPSSIRFLIPAKICLP